MSYNYYHIRDTIDTFCCDHCGGATDDYFAVEADGMMLCQACQDDPANYCPQCDALIGERWLDDHQLEAHGRVLRKAEVVPV